MTAIYLESSAILTRLLAQPEAERVSSVIDDASLVMTSALTLVEVRRSLIRHENSGLLRRINIQRILDIFDRVSPGWAFSDLTPSIQARASQPFPVEPVRTLDGIHLATALDLVKVYPDLSILSLDKRILANLEPLGLVSALPSP